MADSLGLPTAPKKVIRFLETKLIVYLRFLPYAMAISFQPFDNSP